MKPSPSARSLDDFLAERILVSVHPFSSDVLRPIVQNLFGISVPNPYLVCAQGLVFRSPRGLKPNALSSQGLPDVRGAALVLMPPRCPGNERPPSCGLRWRLSPLQGHQAFMKMVNVSFMSVALGIFPRCSLCSISRS